MSWGSSGNKRAPSNLIVTWVPALEPQALPVRLSLMCFLPAQPSPASTVSASACSNLQAPHFLLVLPQVLIRHKRGPASLSWDPV